MNKIRLGILITTKSLGLWGSGIADYSADITTIKMLLPAINEEVPLIPSAYIKGLLRTQAYNIIELLANGGIIDAELFNEKCNKASNCQKCLICKLFGYSGGAYSALHCSNFYAIKKKEYSKDIFRKGLTKELLTNREIWLRTPIDYITKVRIHDISSRAAEGGLYTYENVHPNINFYGELTVYGKILQDEGVKVEQALRLLLLSIAQLNYSYIGRRTLGEVMIIDYEPKSIIHDSYVKIILEKLSEVMV